MRLKGTLLILITLLTITFEVSSQQKELTIKDQPFSERIFFGGNFGLQFGNVTFIDISPLIGYKLTDKLSAGAGITYMYYRQRISGWEYSTSIYGGRLFGRYFILDNIFAHAEYEILNLDAFDQVNKRVDVTNILIGGGYRQQIGGKAFASITALWNINETAYSPYNNPIIRMGIGFRM